MLVAITGGTGFIGTKLVNYHLEHGDQVRVLTRQLPKQWKRSTSISFFEGELVANHGLDAFADGADVLYHCAGQLTDSEKMRSLHVDGTQNLIDAASGQIGHWVQLSSVGVYGPVSEGVISEDFPNNPVGEYEVTKFESDEMVLNASEQGRISCSILRPSNVFGEDMKNQSLFDMIKMIERGHFFFIGRPGAAVNYIHVDNVVEGLVCCGTMPAAKGRIYNISDRCTMEDLVQIISGELSSRLPVLRLPEPLVRWITKVMDSIPGFPLTQSRVDALTNRSVYSIGRIQRELGYTHVISMENGLQKLVRAYRKQDD